LRGFASSNVRGLVDLADKIATAIAVGTAPTQAIDKVFRDSARKKASSGRRSSCMPPRIKGASPGGIDSRSGSARPWSRAGSSVYAQNRDLIEAVLGECAGNLAAAERALKSRGLAFSRKRLRYYEDLWGIRPKRGY